MPKNQQKQRGFQKVIVLWNMFKSKKTGSDFPLNRFSVCVNVFCGQKCTQNSLGNTAQFSIFSMPDGGNCVTR